MQETISLFILVAGAILAALAAATFWFDTCTEAARSLSTGSLNTVHQAPRGASSAGVAGTQSPASLKPAGRFIGGAS